MSFPLVLRSRSCVRTTRRQSITASAGVRIGGPAQALCNTHQGAMRSRTVTNPHPKGAAPLATAGARFESGAASNRHDRTSREGIWRGADRGATTASAIKV